MGPYSAAFPFTLQATSSLAGLRLAAATADAIFSRHSELEAGKAFYADVKGRLAKYGRTPDQLLVLPASTFVLGDTDAEAPTCSRTQPTRRPAGP